MASSSSTQRTPRGRRPRRAAAGTTLKPPYSDAALIAWFNANARDLPWRVVDPASGLRDPYRSLVSEVMLQQTQVSRVLEKYDAFLRRFPTIAALATAPLDDVLAEWSGLGYYRRARHLHACAKAVLERHGGILPRDVPSLLELPGIGRYTAGAIASMVYRDPAPIVDGNVARVLLRVRGQQMDQQSGMAWSWTQAGELAATSKDIAAFNEGLMELGATICTPANPRCNQCPLASVCAANAHNLQSRIPAPKQQAARSALYHTCIIARDDQGRFLLEKRPSHGLWADMYQPPTLETTKKPTRAQLAEAFNVTRLKRVETFLHQTTHRDVHFTIYTGTITGNPRATWFTKDETAALAMGSPQRRALRHRD